MHKNPTEFANLLDAAADRIEQNNIHPGQAIPGVWTIGGDNTPEKVIGTVAARALLTICKERSLPFEKVMESYVTVSRNISLKAQGGPDVMAKNHLRDAAAELRRQSGAAPLRLVS